LGEQVISPVLGLSHLDNKELVLADSKLFSATISMSFYTRGNRRLVRFWAPNTVVSQMSGGLDSTSVTAFGGRGVSPEKINVFAAFVHNIYSQGGQSLQRKRFNLVRMPNANLKIKNDRNLELDVDGAANRDFLAFNIPTALESPRHGVIFLAMYASLAVVAGNDADCACKAHNRRQLACNHRLTRFT